MAQAGQFYLIFLKKVSSIHKTPTILRSGSSFFVQNLGELGLKETRTMITSSRMQV